MDWDGLWRHRHSDARDDALLARERRSRRWAAIVECLEATFGSIEGLKTIELGSGRGDLSALLAERGAQVTLLDSSRQALGQARHRFGRLGLAANYERGDILGTFERWRGRFHVALSSGVIEHFKDDDRTRVIRAHYNALKPRGMAIISVPNAWCIPYRLWKLSLELRRSWPYGMEIPYTKRELVRRARTVGFTRTETRCMGFWQSVGAHWGRSLRGATSASKADMPLSERADRASWLDPALGLTLLLFGWRDER